MKLRSITVLALVILIAMASGCATKKYVRNRVNERVTPLEARTGELEETSRRNTQELGRLSRDIEDVRGRAQRAQDAADRAASSAEQANARVTTLDEQVSSIRTNLDKYTLQKSIRVFFQPNSSAIEPSEMAKLDELASQIKDRNGFLLEIEGYASSEGNPEKNEQLSQARSDIVRRYLADRHNVPLFRMSLIGFGVERPLASNDTADGRAQNRRVEVRLLTNNAVSQQAH
jgi:OmpA-OmpF porin, OOP family